MEHDELENRAADAAIRARLAAATRTAPIPADGLEAVATRASALRRRRKAMQGAMAAFLVVVALAGTLTLLRDDGSQAEKLGATGGGASTTSTSTTEPSTTTTSATADASVVVAPDGSNEPTTVPVADDFPDGGGKLVFTTEGQPGRGIGTVFGNGSGAETFDLPDVGSDPRWSPNRSRIVYASEYDGIRVINADGTGHRVLSSGGYHVQPKWSPDGTKVGYLDISNQPNGNSVVVVDAESGVELARSTAAPKPSLWMWSPDSRSIAFADDGPAPRAVMVLSLVDGSTNTLVSGADEYLSVDWTDDGQVLVGSSTGGGFGSPMSGRVVKVDPRTGDQVEITTRGRSFRRSPGGRLLVYDCCYFGMPYFSILEADGTLVGSFNIDGAMETAWSPDGRLLAVVSYGPSAGYVLHVLNDGGATVSTTDIGTVSLSGLVWSPDSTLVAGLDFRTSLTALLWVYRIEGVGRQVGMYWNGICCDYGVDW